MGKPAKRRPFPKKMTEAALDHGRRQARTLIALRKKAARSKGPAGMNGLLVAEGDSWFDYPFCDVLERLDEKFGFRVESVAHKGDTVEQMAYDQGQLSKLARMFEEIANDGKMPRAILLSGGGNDIAGKEFGFLLNHAGSGQAPINESVVAGVIDERVRFAILSVIGAVTTLSEQYFKKTLPIVMHGYGYSVPDGRGYLGGFWALPGPWLEPGFRQKGYVNPVKQDVDLVLCTGIMKNLIDRFNAMLKTIPASPGLSHVTYLDLRPVLSNALPNRYQQSWANELHPTKPGFEAVAETFRDVIVTFPNP